MKIKISLLFIMCVSLISLDAGFAWANDNSHFAKGKGLYERSKFDQAVRELSHAITDNSQDSGAYLYRANAYFNRCDFNKSISDLTAAINLRPGFALAYYNRAVVYYSMQEYSQAWEDVYKAKKLGYRLDPVFFEQLKEDSGRDQ
jgi:tetratricopeptide (TPR) repeat protein